MDYNRLSVPLFDDKQSGKDLKKQTPNFSESNPTKGTKQVGFRKKDGVHVIKATTLINKININGEHIFESYDKYDNTAFVSDGVTTYNVLLTDLLLIHKNPKK
jgi:hypothetical protein